MNTESPATAAEPQPAPSLPNFAGALRGIWLLTWKSQMTWRRLGLGSLGLLALPLLLILTTSSPRSWAQTHALDLGNPATLISGLSKRLARTGASLPPKQKAELLRIITDEFATAQNRWEAGSGTDGTEPTVETQREQRDQCYDQILNRARAVLDERQFAEFQAIEHRHRSQLANTGTFGWGRTAPFYHCLVDLYFFLMLPLTCVRMCGALIRDELEADTLSFLTTRPISRARLLLAKFLSETLWLQLWMAAQLILMFGAGATRTIPGLGQLLPLFLGVQALAVLAWSALGLLLGQISKRYLALALLYGSVVEMGIGRIPTNINTLSLMRHLKTLLSHNAALQGAFNWPAAGGTQPVLALVTATALFLAAAALLFTYREYHRTTEMQK